MGAAPVFGRLRALWSPSGDDAVRIGERAAMMATLVSSIESLCRSEDRRSGGLLDWAVMRSAHAGMPRPVRRLLDVMSGAPMAAACTAVRCGAALAILSGKPSARAKGGLQIAVATLGVLLGPRERVGADGSDQAAFQAHLAFGIANLSNNRRIRDASVWYLAIQATIAYLASGWVKLVFAGWRDGSALIGVLRTRSYGCEPVWRYFARHRMQARVVVSSMLVMECAFPLVYLRLPWLTRLLTGMAGVFHLTVGAVMGLGRFASAFPALHPAVLAAALPHGRQRLDNRLPVQGAALAATVVCAGVLATAWQCRYDVVSTRALPEFTSRAGVRIRYSCRPGTEATRALVVCIPGLLASRAHFESLADHLGSGARLVILDALPNCPARTRNEFRATVDAIAELIGRLARPADSVIVVGHSLGGLLAEALADQMGTGAAAVLIDATEPEGVRPDGRVAEQLSFLPSTLLLGLGAYLPLPGWVKLMPRRARRTAQGRLRSPRAVRRGVRDWRRLLASYQPLQGSDEIPAIHLWSEQYAEVHEGRERGGATVVPNSSHNSVLVSPASASVLAEELDRIIDATLLERDDGK